jgi:hypothetical protein
MRIFFLFFEILKFSYRVKGAYALGIKSAFPYISNFCSRSKREQKASHRFIVTGNFEIFLKHSSSTCLIEAPILIGREHGERCSDGSFHG